MRVGTAAAVGAALGVPVGVLGAGVYHLATNKPVQLGWVEPTIQGVFFLVMLGFNILSLVLMWNVFRWFTRFLGMSRGPIVTRQIGGHDVRKSRRGTELPPFLQAVRQVGCKHRVVARVRTQEGSEKMCASCGKNLEEGPATQWV